MNGISLSFRVASTDALCDGFQHPSQSLGREPRRPSRRIQKDLRLPDSSLPKGFKDRRVEAHKGNPTIAGAPGIASTQAHMDRYAHSPGFFLLTISMRRGCHNEAQIEVVNLTTIQFISRTFKSITWHCKKVEQKMEVCGHTVQL